MLIIKFYIYRFFHVLRGKDIIKIHQKWGGIRSEEEIGYINVNVIKNPFRQWHQG